jgi:hypothetical protein
VCSGDVHDTSPQALVPIDDQRAEPLRQMLKDGLCEIAEHGYSHQTRSTTDYSEFVGAPFEQQANLIGKGREELEKVFDCKVVTFIPPWNSFDEKTLRAARGAGLSNFSAATDSSKMEVPLLRLIPATCSLVQLDQAIRQASEFKGRSFIVVLFHSYDFKRGAHFTALKETQETPGQTTLRGLDTLLASIEHSGIPVRTISQLATEPVGMDAMTSIESQRLQLSAIQELLPGPLRFRSLFLPQRSASGELAHLLKSHVVNTLLILYGCTFLAGALTAFMAGKLKSQHDYARKSMLGLGCIGCVLCVYQFCGRGDIRIYALVMPLVFFFPILWYWSRGIARCGNQGGLTNEAKSERTFFKGSVI